MQKENIKTTLIELLNGIYAVEVPEGAINFTIDMGYLIFKVPNYSNWCTDSIMANPVRLQKYLESHSAENDYKTGGIPLPGNWEIICTSKECTEELAKELVLSSEWFFPARHTRYVDFKHPYDKENKQKWSEGFGTALESLHSLLTSKGLNPESNYIILKKTA